MLTPKRITEIRARVDALDQPLDIERTARIGSFPRADFLAHAPSDIRDLLVENARLRALMPDEAEREALYRYSRRPAFILDVNGSRFYDFADRLLAATAEPEAESPHE